MLLSAILFIINIESLLSSLWRLSALRSNLGFFSSVYGILDLSLAMHSPRTFREHSKDRIIERITARIGVEVRESSLTVQECKSILSNLEYVPC